MGRFTGLPSKLAEEDNVVGIDDGRDEEIVEAGPETEGTKLVVDAGAAATVAIVVGTTAETGVDGAETTGFRDVGEITLLEVPVAGTAGPGLVESGDVTGETLLTREEPELSDCAVSVSIDDELTLLTLDVTGAVTCETVGDSVEIAEVRLLTLVVTGVALCEMVADSG